MTAFEDHFSGHAAEYAAARPAYPGELFAWLGTVAPGGSPRRAWDCATGNGQAARGLAPHFDFVIATDASVAQLAAAPAPVDAGYVACTAEAAAVATESIALVTIAQALHWLDLPRFYEEVRRVAIDGAVVAAWTYGLVAVDATTDAVLHRFCFDDLAAHWPPERRHVDDGYRSLPFPFEELAPPRIAMQRAWTLQQLLAYVGTWSAVAAARRVGGADPVARLRDELAAGWRDAEVRAVRWPLSIRAGRVMRS